MTFIEGAQAARARPGVLQVAVDVILNDRDFLAREHLTKALLVGIGHAGADGIMEAGDERAGGHPCLAQRWLEHVEIQAALGIHRDGQSLQSQLLQHDGEAEISGRLHDHRVARLAHRAQGEEECLGAADGDDEILRRQRAAPLERAPRQLGAEGEAAGWDIVGGILFAQMLGRCAHLPRHARFREILRIGQGNAQRYEVGRILRRKNRRERIEPRVICHAW